MSEELDRVAVVRLRREGQRYTENRRRLVDVLASAPAPLTIPDILTRAPGLAQSSVYRNLAVLERADLVRRIVTTDEWARYELAEDLTEHHHHLICSSCGAVADFTLTSELESSIESAFQRVARKNGFSIDHHRLDLVGRCRTCG